MRTLPTASLASFAVDTKYLNSKVCVEQLFGRKLPVEHLLLKFLGHSLLSELISSAMQNPVLEHVQKQEKQRSFLRVPYQPFSQISAGAQILSCRVVWLVYHRALPITLVKA